MMVMVLLPGDFDVDDLNVLPISFNTTDHDMVFFHNFPRTYSFTKSITFKKYQRVADALHFHDIERTLNEINSSTMSAWQLVYAHNDYFN